ncbi:MAG: stimulus-sensing domain-containing protein, partial [Rhodospirillales bacterium]|nr:stimulus-sensing domain-containing protein [Rhodospirillales bacterium]
MAPDDTKFLKASDMDADQNHPSGKSEPARSVARCRAANGFSPITRRILAINVLALAILVAGLLYLGGYRQQLVDTELGNLRTQAEMFAAALGEGAVGGNTPFGQELVRETANRIVLRMVESTDLRARLFRLDGTMVADSRKLLKAGREVEVEVLPPPETNSGIMREFFDIYDRLVRWLPGQGLPPMYTERPQQHARHYPEILEAFDGDTVYAVRSLDLDHLIITVAVPIQRYKQVVGALLISETSHKIDDTLLDVRLDILKIFLVSLSITILLSIYLAGTIARPIRRLAMAADRVGRSLNRQDQLPTMKSRDDEIGDLACTLRDMTDALWGRMDAI